MRFTLFILYILACPMSLLAQTFDIDMTREERLYTDESGQGFDLTECVPTWKDQTPFYYSVRVPDGNYRVTVTLGSKKRKASTVVRAECRRLFIEKCVTMKGELKTFTFTVNKRSPRIDDKRSVRIKEREKDYLHWDDKLTLEFNGEAPAVSHIKIEKDTSAVTVFLCGNSTVVDQSLEPWASWGQMIPRWFNENVCFCNLAESGLTATSFLAQGRLDKTLSMLRPGDYVICEFGHNDQKEKAAGSGAYYNFSFALKQFIDRVKAAGGNLIFITPTQRRAFDETHSHILETHGDYPDAMREVAKREGAPVIELHDMTRTFFETLGYEGSKLALVHYAANTFPNQPTALADNTHFNPYGAYEVAKMVVMGFKDLNLPFVNFLRDDWHDYTPDAPDAFDSFEWFPSVFFETVKPDGN